MSVLAFTNDSEADHLSVREPPDALREVGVAHLPLLLVQLAVGEGHFVGFLHEVAPLGDRVFTDGR